VESIHAPDLRIRFFYFILVLSENKIVRKNIVPLIYCNFSKIRSTEIRHLGSRRHFGLFQKSSSMICLYLKAEQNVGEIFEKSQFLKI
jgi:hypothetical protein